MKFYCGPERTENGEIWFAKYEIVPKKSGNPFEIQVDHSKSKIDNLAVGLVYIFHQRQYNHPYNLTVEHKTLEKQRLGTTKSSYWIDIPLRNKSDGIEKFPFTMYLEHTPLPEMSYGKLAWFPTMIDEDSECTIQKEKNQRIQG
ncbi:unnamed protein product, partial [Didymodactylos carnosus]